MGAPCRPASRPRARARPPRPSRPHPDLRDLSPPRTPPPPTPPPHARPAEATAAAPKPGSPRTAPGSPAPAPALRSDVPPPRRTRSRADTHSPAAPAGSCPRREYRGPQIRSHSAVVRCFIPSVSAAYTASICADRAASPNRGSSISAARPIALEQLAPLRVAVRDDADEAVLGRIGPPVRRQHPRIADALFRLAQRAVPQVLDQRERQNRLHHRQMDFLALAGSLAMEQRHADHRRQRRAGQLVDHHRREIARRAVRAGVQRGDARTRPGSGRHTPGILHGAALAEAARAA